MDKKNWKIFSYYESGITLFFCINIIIDIINERILDKVISKEILTYSFWLSLGLFLGFRLCKYEVRRILTKNNV